ncbi:MAG: hypothetical protein U0325_23155 [Polyangiales bacterium]
MADSNPAPGRLRAAVLGALIFGFLVPCLWASLTMVFVELARTRTSQETVGLTGFLLAGVGLPAGAVLGALLGAIGDPSRSRRRWLVGAGITVVVSALFWGLVLRPA